MDSRSIFRSLTFGARFKNREKLSSHSNVKLSSDKPPKHPVPTRKEARNNQIPVTAAHEEPLKNQFEDDVSEEEHDDEEILDGDDSLNIFGEGKSDSDSEETAKIRIYAGASPSAEVIPTSKRKRKKSAGNSVVNLEQIKLEEISRFRKRNNIHIYGNDIAAPVRNFDELSARYGVSSVLLNNIKNVGYENPTPIQMQAIPLLLEKRDLLASAPTGSGKTAAFLIPMLHSLAGQERDGYKAVIVSPTRELAKQTFFEVERLGQGMGLKAHMIGNTPKVLKKFRGSPKSSRKHDILVTTPNRLVTLLKAEPAVINLSSVRWLVIDESDKLFEADKEGGFRDQLAIIYKACSNPGVRRALFSATFAFEVEEWCRLNLDNVVMCSIGARNAATETVDQKLVFVGSQSGKVIALRQVLLEEFCPPVLVFVQTKQRAIELHAELIQDSKLRVDVIHSGRDQKERDLVVHNFRAGKVWTLIATELMGRGIDFIGVNLVVNYDFPSTSISYIHRIGRTGRAGKRGKSVTFFTEKDSVYLRSIANVMERSGCVVPPFMLELNKPSKSLKKGKRRKFDSSKEKAKKKSTGIVKKPNSFQLRSKGGRRKMKDKLRRMKKSG